MDNKPTNINILENHWEKLPAELKEVFVDDMCDASLEEIATHYKLSIEQSDALKHEVYFVLFILEPITSLVSNIEKIGIPTVQAIAIAKEIELITLFSVMDLLKGMAVTSPSSQMSTPVAETKGTVPDADKNIKERLILRPDGVLTEGAGDATGGPKPLTREEVLRALAPKRTMASDIASLQQKTNTPTVGYGAEGNSSDAK